MFSWEIATPAARNIHGWANVFLRAIRRQPRNLIEDDDEDEIDSNGT
jgi:hypothetical protein